MASMSYNALPHDADAWETEAQRLSMHRPLVVTSRRWQHLFQTAKNLSPVFFDSFHPNPDYTDCSLGYEVYQREHCDGLIACGGGSAMDTAKGIKALALSETPVHALRGEFLSDRPVPPFLAIPTTAGSGSEATPNAVLYKEGNKCSLSHPLLTPDQAIWDARLLNSTRICRRNPAPWMPFARALNPSGAARPRRRAEHMRKGQSSGFFITLTPIWRRNRRPSQVQQSR